MLCQNCKQKNATTHIHSVVNGVVTDKYLCSECAAHCKTSGIESNDFLSLLSSFLGTEPKSNKNIPLKKCESCGMTFEEIVNTGKLGCADCYKTFRTQLEPTVLKLHGSLKHSGKAPVSVGAYGVVPQEYKSETESEKLKKQLQDAILREDFETAAVLRDKIKALGE